VFINFSSLEACLFGAYPILPNRLVYPEIYPKECLFNTEAQLLKKLRIICTRAKKFRQARHKNQLEFLYGSTNTNETNNRSNVDHALSDTISKLIDSNKSFFDKYKWTQLKSEFLSIFIE
jgi:hypothetical protein